MPNVFDSPDKSAMDKSDNEMNDRDFGLSMGKTGEFDDIDSNDEKLVEFVKRQKQQIKELQEKLESSKRQYKDDKADIE